MKYKKENQREFVVNVYSANGEINPNGYACYNKGMVYFEYGGNGLVHGIRGESSFLVKTIASDLSRGFRKNSIDQVKFIFPDYPSSIPEHADGYFGKPLLYVGAILLKPLPKRRRFALTKEINKFHKITDKWGKEIILVA